MPIKSMGCVHTHQGMHTIEGWSNPSRIRSVMEKTREINRKPKKIGQAVNETPTPKLEHDKIWARWASDKMSKSMLERV